MMLPNTSMLTTLLDINALTIAIGMRDLEISSQVYSTCLKPKRTFKVEDVQVTSKMNKTQTVLTLQSDCNQ